VVRFGLFELDVSAGELRRQGRRIKLQDQPLQVLELLLSRPGEMVTREELQQALWPADTFVEFDQGLNTAIKKIRLALGDSADNPRFVETIPRKGYRFIAPVELAPREASAGPQNVTPPARRPSRRLISIAAAITIAIAGTLVTVVLKAPPAEPPESVVPLTTYPGLEGSPSFSPDGSQVAFDWNGGTGEIWDIYVKLVGEEHTLRLTNGRAFNHSPAWSPDGRSIAFLRSSGNGEEVLLIPALGGPERKLGQVRSPEGAAFSFDKLSWTPDGKWLAVADRPSNKDECSLFLLSVETGEKRRLTSPPAKALDVMPAVSPDSRLVAFSRRAARTSDIYLLPLSADLTPAGEPRRLTFIDGRHSIDPAWTRDGGEIIFASGPFHLPQLWRVSASGRGKPRRLGYAEPIAVEPAVSRAKPLLAFKKQVWDVNIWRLAIPAPPGRPISPSVFAPSTYLEHMPRFSPDGRRVAFISNRSGSQQIWVAAADGSNPHKITSFDGPECAGLAWSPDGEQIVLELTGGGQSSIYVIGAAGGNARKIIDDGFAPGWSGDGNWIYFTSTRTGANQVWKARLASGSVSALTQVTKNGGEGTEEAADGRCIYYERDEAVWRAPVDGGEEVRLAGPLSLHGNFAVARSGIYFMSPKNKNGRWPVQLFSFADRRSKTVALIENYPEWGMTVSPDERWLLYVQLADVNSNLMLVENFR